MAQEKNVTGNGNEPCLHMVYSEPVILNGSGCAFRTCESITSRVDASYNATLKRVCLLSGLIKIPVNVAFEFNACETIAIENAHALKFEFGNGRTTTTVVFRIWKNISNLLSMNLEFTD